MIASTFYDPVLGVDIHILLVPTPAGPVPTPLPLPFVGIVLDPIGLAMNAAMGGSLVLVNGLPATNCGTNVMAAVPHLPVPGPPQTGKFGDDAELFFGALNVEFGGSLAVRLAEIAMSCGDPVRMPTSRVLAIPKGPLVIIPRAPVPDLKLIATLIAFKVAGMILKAIAKLIGKGLRALQRGILKNFFQGISERLKFKGETGGKGFKQMWNDTVCFLTGHPVDVATGRVITSQTDLELFGALPLAFSRRYDSSSSSTLTRMGYGWADPYDQVMWPERGAIKLRAEDGREITFSTLQFPDRVLSTGREVFLPRERLTLRALSTLHFTVTNSAGVIREFARVPGGAEREARLVRVRDRLGNEQRFTYNREGRLEAVTDPAGRSLRFDYDRAGLLAQTDVVGMDGTVQPVAAYRYDAAGDLIEARDALGHAYRYEYVEHLLVKETNRNGLSFYFQYDGVDEDAKCIRTWGDGGIYDHAITYDTAARRTLVENSLGQITLYQLDEANQVISITDALGHVETYEYDDRSGQKTKDVAPDGAETLREYDARGNLVKTVAPDGAEVALTYDERGQLVLARDAIGGEWHWSYGARGEVTGRRNPLGETNQFHWAGALTASPRGMQLVAVTDPLGQHTELAYDGNGNLTSLKNPDSTVTQWGYDGFGRTRTTTNPNGAIQRRERDALGRVVHVLEADGNQRNLAYDPEGNVVRAQDRHYDVGFEYAGMNRLVARSQAGTRIEFLYDTEDRLVAIKNEHGFAYRFILGPNGDVDEEWGFDDLRRRYVRDPAGRVALVARPQGKKTTYAYDRAGRVIGVEHSDGTSEAYAYRLDGAMLSAQNPNSVLSFERDALGRITRELMGADWVSSAYDARGLRRSVKSSKGLEQRIRRNAMGDVLAIEAQVSGGAPTAPISPSQGANPAPATDSSGNAASPGATQTSFSASFERDRLGLELERNLPGGVRAQWQRDNVGRPIRQEVWRGDQFHAARQYIWDVNDRLTKIIDAMTGPVTYGHDALGNLASAAYADGRVDLRLPDAVGNLFRTQDRTDRKYGPAGQILESRNARGVTTYAYDAEGNLIQKLEPDGGAWKYDWNGAGMLTRVTRPEGNTVTFEYDALARRTAKTYRGKVTRWIWDGNVPLHEWVELDPTFDASTAPALKPQQAESAAEIQAKARLAFLGTQPAQGPPPTAPLNEGTPSAPITWLFEPESFAPLAKLIDGARYGIITDHLGTPQAMFDDAGLEVWSAEIDTYGDLRNVRGPRAACPFRWPGQYEDAETGLYYNRLRYYSAENGAFLSQDPLGRAGGLALYSYVHDPLSWHDPFGLAGAPAVTALFEQANQVFEDVNATAREPRQSTPLSPPSGGKGFTHPNSNLSTAHAELGAMNQASEAGLRGGHGVLVVQGKPICGYCEADIKKMAQKLELDSLEIHDLSTGRSATFSKDELRNVADGGVSLGSRLRGCK